MGSPRAERRAGQAGVTLPELLVGMTIGLGLATLAVQWLVDQTRIVQRQWADARARQELSSLSRMIESQVRMAGHAPAWRAPEGTPSSSPFAVVEAAPQILRLHIDRNNNGVLDTTDALAFLLSQGRLQLRIGNGGAQELHEATVLRLANFAPELVWPAADSGSCVPLLRWTLSGQTPYPLAQATPLQVEGAVTMPNLTATTCTP